MTTIALGDAPLTLADVGRIANGGVRLDLSERGHGAIARARAIVDRLVDERIPAYGITTGVGSQKDFAVDPQAISAYNNLMITGHATFAPGRNAPERVVRAALAIQLSLFALGRSGIRPQVADALLERLNADELPVARLGMSVGASDIVAMSQLSAPLIGRMSPGTETAHRRLDSLKAKEAISLLNSNSMMLAEGTLALLELRALTDAAHVIGALSMEGLRGNLSSWSERVDIARGQPGQIRVGRALRAALAESRLWQPGEARFLQDPLSFRCIPQIHGAVEAAYDFASNLFEAELGAACDNPMIDTESGLFISHGNMETTACALAMDTLRQAVAKMIEASGQRIHKIQWPGFSGLPTSLAREAGAIGGVQFLNFGHIAAAAVGAVRQAAHPALLSFSGQIDDGVEDVAGNAPQSVAETVRMLEPAWTVIAIEASCAVWAVERRGIDPFALGTGLRPLFNEIRALLPIGSEGQAIYDLGPVVETVRKAFGIPVSLGGQGR